MKTQNVSKFKRVKYKLKYPQYIGNKQTGHGPDGKKITLFQWCIPSRPPPPLKPITDGSQGGGGGGERGRQGGHDRCYNRIGCKTHKTHGEGGSHLPPSPGSMWLQLPQSTSEASCSASDGWGHIEPKAAPSVQLLWLLTSATVRPGAAPSICCCHGQA